MAQMSRRIAYVSSRYPVLSEAFIIREVLALQRAGVEVSVFSLKRPHDDLVNRDLEQICGTVYWTPHLASWALLSDNLVTFLRSPVPYLTTALANAWRLRHYPVQALKVLGLFPKMIHYSREIRRQGFRGINGCWANLPTLLASVAKRFFDIPYCMTCRAWDIFVPMNQLDLPQKLSTADVVRANSGAAAQFVKQFCASVEDERKIRCVYNPYDVDSIRRRDNLPTGTPRIVAGGSLVEQKGLTYLLDAAALLETRGVSCRMEIVGEGPLRGALEAQRARLGLEESVEFVGTLPNHVLMEKIALATAFVLPSVHAATGEMDGIPNVLIESLSLGVPVVSTSISGIPELVEDGVTGLLAPPNDAEHLADAIQRLISDPELQRRFGVEGRRRVESMFEMSRNAQELIEIYEAGGLL